jgi:hypothetical protein
MLNRFWKNEVKHMAFVQPGRVRGEMHEPQTNNSQLLLNCILDRRWAEAALLLPELSSVGDERTEVLFNAALVYAQANEPEKALDLLERALTAFERKQLTGRSPRNEVYRKLRITEIADKIYLQPMRSDIAERFPDVTGENILLALTDIALRCGLTDRAKAFAASLVGEEFSAFKAKIGL